MATWNLKTDAQHYDERGYWEYDLPRHTNGSSRNAIIDDISKQLGENVVFDENFLGGFRFRGSVNRKTVGYVSFWS